VYTSTLALDLADVVPSLAGPKRPQDRVALSDAASAFAEVVTNHRQPATERQRDVWKAEGGAQPPERLPGDPGPQASRQVEGEDYAPHDGSVVIAAITSCTNTSHPYVMIGAGLVARQARQGGLTRKPRVKTSLAAGSQVVTEYLRDAGLQEDLDAIGFNLVGYGCTTCIGNSGPLPEPISKAIHDGDLVACSVLSGNRNFEGRINPDTRANYLASPPLVVVYAIAGDMNIDVTKDPIGTGSDGQPVYMRDLWPTQHEIAEIVHRTVTREAFQSRYADVFAGDERWRDIPVKGGLTYEWPSTSTYVQNPPYFEGMGPEPGEITDIHDARILALLGDSVTTDHI